MKMKTYEKKAYALVQKYKADLKKLEREYDRRFNNVPVNQAGEASADYILRVNEWHYAKEKELRETFIQDFIRLSATGNQKERRA